MVRSLEEVPTHDGDVTVVLPQKSEVVPQKPYLLQQTFKGQVSFWEYWAPQPGSHSDLAVQVPTQLAAEQKSAPNPQLPNLEQHP
jgi:hypothetical protein